MEALTRIIASKPGILSFMQVNWREASECLACFKYFECVCTMLCGIGWVALPLWRTSISLTLTLYI